MNLDRSSGVQLHPTSLPSGRLGKRGAPVRGLARRCRAIVVADAAARPARPARLAVQVGVGVRGLAGVAGAAARTRSPRCRARLPRAQRVLDRRLGRRGSVADQVRFDREWAALRSHAAERGVQLIGDVPIYVARGLGRPPRAPRAVPRRRGRRHAAGRLHRQGPAVGQPAVRLAGAAAARVSLVDRALPPHVRALRRRADRPLPRLRLLLGGAARCAPRAERALAARAGARAVRRRAATRSARLPLIAEDLGVITPAVDAAAPVARPPRDGRPAVRVRLRRPRGTCTTRSTTPSDVVVYTGTHDNDTVRGWYDSLPDAVRAEVDAEIERHGVRERAPQWSLIRLAFASPARVAMVQMQDVLGLGSEARMNTPGRSAGAWKWRLDRMPGKRPRPSPAGCDRGVRPRSRLRRLAWPLPPLPTRSSTSIAATTTWRRSDYDAKWGISFGEIGRHQVLGKVTKMLGDRPGPFARSLEIGAGTGYFTLNLMQDGVIETATCTDISPGHARDARGATRGRSACRSRPRRATPPRCRSRTRASTSCSATRCCTTCPTSTARSPSSGACWRRAGRCSSPASRRATATGSPPCPSARRCGSRRRGGARSACGPRPPARAAARTTTRSRGWSTSTRSCLPTSSAHAGGAGFEGVRVRGEELLANWFGWFNRTLEATADPKDIPWGWIQYAYRGYIAAAGGRPPRARAAAAAAPLLQPDARRAQKPRD